MTDGAVAGLPGATRLLREVVAPTTLATGLLFYFGWSHAYWFFDYFGVNATVLGLSTSDYLMRGLDGLFVPLVVAAVVATAAVWGHALLGDRLDGRRPWWWPRALAGAGALLCLNGLSRIFVATPVNRPLAVAPLSLALGVATLAVAARLRTVDRSRPGGVGVAEYLGVLVLIGLSLFWAANDYAAAVGRSRAAQFVRDLPSHSEAIVYSRERLNLGGVPMARCGAGADGGDAAYGFRYAGLALVLQSDDQYVLLPKTWTRRHGVAVVLPRTDDVRVEFLRPSAAASRPATC